MSMGLIDMTRRWLLCGARPSCVVFEIMWVAIWLRVPETELKPEGEALRRETRTRQCPPLELEADRRTASHHGRATRCLVVGSRLQTLCGLGLVSSGWRHALNGRHILGRGLISSWRHPSAISSTPFRWQIPSPHDNPALVSSPWGSGITLNV
jgi:hypothetical protein